MMNEGVMNDEISGTARLKRRERKRWLLAALGLAIMVVDGLFMWQRGILSILFSNGSSLPPDLASGMATGILVGCVIAIPLKMRVKQCDEHDLRARRLASQTGFMVFLIALPVWTLFAIGGVLPAMNVSIVYAAAAVAFLAVFLWNKFR